jgi:hypothetical protein
MWWSWLSPWVGIKAGNVTANKNYFEKKLPARFARLARDFAIILIRKSFATAPTAAASIAAAATIAAA